MYPIASATEDQEINIEVALIDRTATTGTKTMGVTVGGTSMLLELVRGKVWPTLERAILLE